MAFKCCYFVKSAYGKFLNFNVKKNINKRNVQIQN